MTLFLGQMMDLPRALRVNKTQKIHKIAVFDVFRPCSRIYFAIAIAKLASKGFPSTSKFLPSTSKFPQLTSEFLQSTSEFLQITAIIKNDEKMLIFIAILSQSIAMKINISFIST